MINLEQIGGGPITDAFRERSSEIVRPRNWATANSCGMNSPPNRRAQPFFFFSTFLKFNLAAIQLSWYSVSAALGVHPAEEALDSRKCPQWPIENVIKKTNLLPTHLSLSLPSLSIPGWKSNKRLPVCPGITVCDFSLTSQAALWHGGVIVSGGSKPFCHGRVEKDKAGPQSICLAGHCCIVSPEAEEDRDWHMSGKFTRGTKPPAPACLPTAWDCVQFACEFDRIAARRSTAYRRTWRCQFDLKRPAPLQTMAPLFAAQPQNHATSGQY